MKPIWWFVVAVGLLGCTLRLDLGPVRCRPDAMSCADGAVDAETDATVDGSDEGVSED